MRQPKHIIIKYFLMSDLLSSTSIKRGYINNSNTNIVNIIDLNKV